MLMQQTQSRVIDGITYATAQFSATKGLKLMHRVSRFIAAPLGKMFAETDVKAMASTKSIADFDLSGKAIGEAVQALFEACDEATFEATVKELLSNTTRDSKPIVFDVDFAGKMAHLFAVLAFVLEVNYSDFFGGIAGAFRRIKG